MTATDGNRLVGQLILHFADEEKTVLWFGFVIVDDSWRGQGYGKAMIRLALQYAFEILKVQKVTLGVLENNPGAYYCYCAAGFREAACRDRLLEDSNPGTTWFITARK